MQVALAYIYGAYIILYQGYRHIPIKLTAETVSLMGMWCYPFIKKGILAVVKSGMTTDDGRVCTSRTWFVNPNIMFCSPKDDVDKATQKIFKRSLKNFKGEGSSKKHQLPIYLF